jgi:hypothetical protein
MVREASAISPDSQLPLQNAKRTPSTGNVPMETAFGKLPKVRACVPEPPKKPLRQVPEIFPPKKAKLVL